MLSNCPICGNVINHGREDGFCKYCRKSYHVVETKRGKKRFYTLEEKIKGNKIPTK